MASVTHHAVRCVPLAALLLLSVGCNKADEPATSEGTGAGGQSNAASSERITVGFSQIGAESAWRTAETESIRSEAKARGFDLNFADAGGEQMNQVAALRNFVAQDVDAIILAPKVETGWEPILREVKAAGIPVILVDRGIDVSDDSLYFTLIASDFVEEGRMAGAWLAEKTGGTANIVELFGTPASAPANDRAKGFREAIADHSDMRIIRSQTAEFERTLGKQVMEVILKSETEPIHAVYAHNDDMALGAIKAIEEEGLTPGEDIIVISIDAVRDAFVAMTEGTLNATVECNPLLGPQAFDAVEAALRGETLPKWIKVEDRLFEQAEAAEVLPTRKY